MEQWASSNDSEAGKPSGCGQGPPRAEGTCFHAVGYTPHLADTTSLLTKEPGCVQVSGTDLLIPGKVVPSLAPRRGLQFICICNRVMFVSGGSRSRHSTWY